MAIEIDNETQYRKDVMRLHVLYLEKRSELSYQERELYRNYLVKLANPMIKCEAGFTGFDVSTVHRGGGIVDVTMTGKKPLRELGDCICAYIRESDEVSAPEKAMVRWISNIDADTALLKTINKLSNGFLYTFRVPIDKVRFNNYLSLAIHGNDGASPVNE